MNLNELLNPWAALRRARLEVDRLRREQATLVDELRLAELRERQLATHGQRLLKDLKKAQKNDNRGKDGRFKKGDSK